MSNSGFFSKKTKIKALKLKGRTWERDSYGLFDFDAKGIFENKFQIDRPITILREQNNILIRNQNSLEQPTKTESLGKILKINGEFYVSNWREIKENNFSSKDLWMVVGTKICQSKSKFLLEEGTIFKIGRLAFRVLHSRVKNDELALKDNTHSLISSVKFHYETNNNFLEFKNQNTAEESQNNINRVSSQKICRICLNESEDAQNPLLSPCLCSGSLKFIHFKCLQTWTQSRLNLDKMNGIISIEWNGLTCELCKSHLPLTFKHEESFYDLLDLKEQNTENFENFLVLESYSKHFKVAGIHYIDFTKRNSISLGRLETSDIRLTDISVSRDHAKIIFEKGSFYLKDEDSKFGTLVLVSKPVKISESKLIFQNGRTTLTVSPMKNCLTMFSLCPFSYNSSEEGGLQNKIKEKK